MTVTVQKRRDWSFQRAVYLISKWFDELGWISAAAMMLIAVLNVVLRTISMPMQGAVELTSFCSALIVGFGLAYCLITGGHVRVQIITARLKARGQIIAGIARNVFTLATLSIMFWGTLTLAIILWGEVSVMLKIFYAPFIAAISMCCFLACLAAIADTINLIMKNRPGTE
jgi:TRAP-type C4-dicarboxylate transport system permease small subunit